MESQISLGGILLDVIKKDIKNIHLSVYPPTGRVRISAPLRMKLDTIRVYAISKLGWIKQQQRKFRQQDRETPREYLDRESHYVWGRRYLLKVIDKDAPPSVELTPRRLILRVRPRSSESKKRAILEGWYRQQLKAAAPTMLGKWQALIGVKVEDFAVRRMKTKWGSCNVAARRILLNSELAKKPANCLEYIVVHEMVHLLERRHGDRFVALMNKYLPGWRARRDDLNREPLSHETWEY